MKPKITVAKDAHLPLAEDVCHLMELAAHSRGTGIAKRTPEYVRNKIREGKAVIAIDNDKLAGFCYIETWGHGKFVANSGLVVAEEYRKIGLARKIKAAIFELSREKFPDAKIFGITTSLAVMKINSGLGYKPVTFSELTDDQEFWKGCQSCRNYDILQRNEQKMCLCTGMLHDPEHNNKKFNFKRRGKFLERLRNIKQSRFLKNQKND